MNAMNAMDDDDDVDDDETKPKQKKKKKKPARLNPNNYETAVQAPPTVVADSAALDMSAWSGMGLHDSVIAALAKLGFVEPTPIQRETVPLGAVMRRDVVGAAETGSGKTLSFGLPIINHIVVEREARAAKLGADAAPERDGKLQALVLVPTRELAIQVASHLRAIADPCGVLVVTIVGGMAVQKQERMLKRRPPIIVATPGRFWQMIESSPEGAFISDMSGLRYFALDEADRMVEKAHFDDLHLILKRFPIFVDNSKKAEKANAEAAAQAAVEAANAERAAAAKKAERLANNNKRNKILSELEGTGGGGDGNDGLTVEVEEFGGNPNDEAAPTAEAEAELPDLRPRSNRRRQTFVFSATLGVAVADALAKSSHIRAARTRRGLAPLQAPAQSSGDGLRDAVDAENDARTAQLLDALEFQGAKPPAIVDLTNTSLTVKQLREYRIECTLEAKDVFLYAFLEMNRGRTLVFVNAISAIRRLLPLLTLLKVPVWSLHAQKQQRQRLKVLDRFRAATYGVLIATDVAARGLDIPSVDHVVHFQVPRTIELYVHRTGRTARAQREGVSLMIVSPEDRDNFLKLVRLPGKKDKAFTPMVFDPEKMVAIERRVHVARELEVAQHRRAKRTADKRDLVLARAAKEAGVGNDDDISDDDGGEEMAMAMQRRMLKRELKAAESADAQAGAPALSKKAKRKAKHKDKVPNRLVADESGDLVPQDRNDPNFVLPNLRRSLNNELSAPLTKRRRAFLSPDTDTLRLMTGSRPDALSTTHDEALLRVAHPTASLEAQAWATKPFFKVERSAEENARREARRAGRQKAVEARRAAKKAKFAAMKEKRHGKLVGPGDDDDDDSFDSE